VTPLIGHGVGSVKDLPVPQWLFLYGAAVVLIASFIALGLLWRRPLLARYDNGRTLPPWLQALAFSRWLRVVLGALSFALFVLVLATALVGERLALGNLAPTFVYVVFWIGMVAVVVLFGNVWPALNPWKAAADAAGWLAGRLGWTGDPFGYPARLGHWPAGVLLFAFVALELAYQDPADPRAIGVAILVYSAATWIGALLFGRHWWPNGDGFTVYFGLLSRIAPIAVVERGGTRGAVLRPPFVGLATLRVPRPGTLAFVAVMLGSVAFDGASRTTWWQERLVERDELGRTLLNLGGLLGAIVLVAAAYLLAVTVARALADTDRSLSRAFVASLVPIALVYVVAHYFSLLVIQGQFVVPLASDPFGWGWDLFGTADVRPNLAPLSPSTVWYVQVGALIVGHVAGLTLAHDRALELFRSPGVALRTQYALLALMVVYTVGGLWLLSQD
jgi:hypothetical protein